MSRKKPFIERKIVTCSKEHECAVCGEQIEKGSRVLNEHGYSEMEGYFSSYFHLSKRKGCYLDFLEAVQPEFAVEKMIQEAVVS